MRHVESRRRARQAAGVLGAAVVVVIIIWIDVATGLWQDLVILAGLAAGLVTFLLTVLVLDRVLARSAERRWAPVNRLALSEFLHAIADEAQSEISRGRIVPRALDTVGAALSDDALVPELERLRLQIVTERQALSQTLGQWAQFLTGSGNNEQVLLHVAEIALRLDTARDASLEFEERPQDAARRDAFNREVAACNSALAALAAELQMRLDPVTDAVEMPARSADTPD